MILIFTIFIVIPLYYFALSRQTAHFVNLYGLGLNLMPLIQMLLYPSYRLEEHYRDVVIEKIIFDLIFLFSIILFLFSIKSFRINRLLISFFLLYLILNIPSVIYSEDISKSGLIYVVAILAPICFGVLLYNTANDYKVVLNYAFNWIGISLIVKYASIALNGLRTGIWNFTYGAYDFSIIRGNSVVTTLAIFLPLFVVTTLNKNSVFKWRLISWIALFSLITSGSRMGLLCVGISILANYRNYSLYRILIFSSLLFVLNGVYMLSSSASLFELFSSRFTERGSLVTGATEDGRVFIWSSAIELLSERKGRLIGLGMFSEFSNYSNAHNLFINHWIERGIFGVASVLLLLFHLIGSSWRNRDLRWIVVGTFLLVLASLTGEDFFTISRVVHGYSFYLLVILIIYFYKLAPPKEHQ